MTKPGWFIQVVLDIFERLSLLRAFIEAILHF